MLVPGAAPSGFDVEFSIDIPLDFWELEDMAQALVEGTVPGDIIFVEASFPTGDVDRSYQVLDSLLSSLLAQESILFASCKVLVLMRELPNRVDQVFDLLGVGELDHRLAVVDDTGLHLGDYGLASELLRVLDAVPAPDLRAEQTILRHRGIFQSKLPGRTTHYLFYYDVLPAANAHFQRQIIAGLEHLRPAVVLFDTSKSGSWFASMVQAACVHLQTINGVKLTPVDVSQWIAYHDGSLQDPQRSRVESAAVALQRSDTAVVVVVPAYASGRSLTQALEAIGMHDVGECAAIAVFADEAVPLETSPILQMRGMAKQRYGRRTIDVHCLNQVELRILERDNWLVQVAKVLHEVRDLSDAQPNVRSLDQVALWSLFEEYGVTEERVPASGREAKLYFPDLAHLNAWDAHWLAEALVVNILGRLPKSNRAALLIVIPAEENGTQPISRALLERCRTAVLQIPRRMIQGDEPPADEIVKKLRSHSADTIVVLDESTVTHRTLENLAKLVERCIRVRPDLLGAVVDLSSQPPSLDIPFFSLTNWAALAEV